MMIRCDDDLETNTDIKSTTIIYVSYVTVKQSVLFQYTSHFEKHYYYYYYYSALQCPALKV